MSPDVKNLPPLDNAEPGTKDYEILEWCNARLKQGRHFIESQVGYEKIESNLAAIFRYEKDSSTKTPAAGLSKTFTNEVGKIAEDITAMMTDTKLFWNYSTNNALYQDQARIANQQAEDWYTRHMIDLRIEDVIRYATFAATGYAHLYYSRRLNDMMVEALDPRHVFPIEPISHHTIQDCLGVIIRRARTPEWIKDEYDKDVAADAGATGLFGWFTRAVSNAMPSGGPLSRRKSNDEPIPATPTVYENVCYLKDKRLNKTGKDAYMGKWGTDENGRPTPETQWSYIVKPGQPLYPFGRMICWTTECLLSDGPSPYWHAMFPLVKMTLNPWPGSFLGKAPLSDLVPLNESLNGLLRVIDDHAAQVAQPGATADRNVSKAELEKFNTRLAGAKIRTNLASGKGIMINHATPMDQGVWEHLKWIVEKIRELGGTADIQGIANLNQLPSGDTIDTLMKAMTPGLRLKSRRLEGFMKELAEMYLYCIMEFDTLPKRIARLGPNAVTHEDFDYDPGTFIPDDVSGGQHGDVGASLDALISDTPRPRYVRAKALAQSMAFRFKETSLLNSAAQADLMQLFLLAKMGYIDFFTVMEAMGKSNLLPPSIPIPNTIVERLQLQQKLGIGMVANAQGRKATNEAPPQIQAGSGGDPTLTTS
jgi:hypothetical protein